MLRTARVCEGCDEYLVDCCCENPQDTDAWLYKDEKTDLTMREFLDWYRSEGFGDAMPVGQGKGWTWKELPWDAILRVIAATIMVLGVDAEPEAIARRIKPLLRPAEEED